MIKEKSVLMLISDINKIMHDEIRSVTTEMGLTACYRPIIFALTRHDGLTQLELVRQTRFTAPTISLTLQKMEQEEYVIRKPSVDDARKIQVFLTDKGHEYDQQMISTIKDLESRILSKFSKEELDELEVILRKLINTMCEEFGVYKDENI